MYDNNRSIRCPQRHMRIMTLHRRALFPPSRLSQEINAKFAAAGFGWLVGEAEVRPGLADVRCRPCASMLIVETCLL